MSSLPSVVANQKAKDLRHWKTFEKHIVYDEISRRLLERHGPKRICYDLGMSYNTLRKILRSEDFRKHYHAMERRINEPVEASMRDERMLSQERLTHGSQRALTRLYEMLEKAERPKDVINAANSVLDRNPQTARVRRAASMNTDIIHFDDRTAELLGKAMSAAFRRGHAVDPLLVEAKVVDSETSSNGT